MKPKQILQALSDENPFAIMPVDNTNETTIKKGVSCIRALVSSLNKELGLKRIKTSITSNGGLVCVKAFINDGIDEYAEIRTQIQKAVLGTKIDIGKWDKKTVNYVHGYGALHNKVFKSTGKKSGVWECISIDRQKLFNP